MKTLEKDIQKVTDDAVKHVDDMTANKEERSPNKQKNSVGIAGEFYSKERIWIQILPKFYRWLIIDEKTTVLLRAKDGQTYALARKKVSATVGDTVKVLPTRIWKQLRDARQSDCTQDQFGWGRVTEVRKDLGVLLDTGLPNRCQRYSWARNSGLEGRPTLHPSWNWTKVRIWGLLAYQKTFNICGSSCLQQHAGSKTDHCRSQAVRTLFTCQKITCLALSI